MQSRRDFFKTAALGSVGLAAGLKLGGVFDGPTPASVTLHGFVPADENAVRNLLTTFLAVEDGELPTPTVDIPAPWRPAVAGALRQAGPRYRQGTDRVFDVQLTALENSLPADVMLQQEARVLDPQAGFGRRLLAVRESLLGRKAEIAVTCRLGARPAATAAQRVLAVETENGLQDRIALGGAARTLALAGPAGLTEVRLDADGARVISASCRHETCRRQNLISQPGELIACAPNRLVLRIETV